MPARATSSAPGRIPFRQIGIELADQGIADENFIPLLPKIRGVRFFTRDQDFFAPNLCHPACCLAFLNVPQAEAAAYIRRFLRHPTCHTHSQRMGIVARSHPGGVQFWQMRKRGDADWV